MYAERHTVIVATDGTGAGTGYTPTVTGRVLGIRYVKTDYANGVDFTITAETTGETIWTEENVNASTSRYPRAATHSTAGVAALYAAGGTAVQEPVVIVNDRVSIAVAQGGATTTGTFYVIVG